MIVIIRTCVPTPLGRGLSDTVRRCARRAGYAGSLSATDSDVPFGSVVSRTVTAEPLQVLARHCGSRVLVRRGSAAPRAALLVLREAVARLRMRRRRDRPRRYGRWQEIDLA